MRPIRVIIADDHPLFRKGVKELLRKTDDIEVIGEAGDGYEALRLAKGMQPDIVLLDIAMSGLNGIDTAIRIKKDFPAMRTVMLSMHTSEEYVSRAMRAGASGYILKGSDIDELEYAIRKVFHGKTYLKRPAETGCNTGSDISPYEVLTARQREVLQLIAEGCSTKEVAARLCISVKTADVHRMQLMKRLDIHDTAGLVRYAVRTGIISPA